MTYRLCVTFKSYKTNSKGNMTDGSSKIFKKYFDADPSFSDEVISNFRTGQINIFHKDFVKIYKNKSEKEGCPCCDHGNRHYFCIDVVKAKFVKNKILKNTLSHGQILKKTEFITLST